MKRVTKILFAVILVVVFIAAALVSFGAIPLNNSSVSTAHDKALAFIKNVLPIDFSRYNVTLKSYGAPKLPSEIGSDPLKGFETEVLTYVLESKEGTLQVICTVKNGAVNSCLLEVVRGSVILDRHYSDPIDAAEGFLKKYQSYYKTDLADMVNTLHNVDSLKNTTLISGSLKLNIEIKSSSTTAFSNTVRFR